MIAGAAVVLGAYLLGSLPSALVLVWTATGKDVRLEGSGNIGATNALRAAGWRVGASVTVIDIAKGAIPVALMRWIDPRPGWIAATLVAAVLGHCFPVWLDFKGGKGVATGLGVFLVVDPKAALWAVVVWLIVFAVSGWVSLASMVASAGFPVVLSVVGDSDPAVLAAVIGVALLIVIRHRSNIRLLLSGSEPRLKPWWRR
jgi:glycerol-3-phosphate acyltransferase PlsY